MKSRLNSLLITAAGLTLSAVAAYGQTKLEANVPFPFQTVAGTQAAGRYAIVPVTTGNAVIKLENVDTRKVSLTGIGIPSGDNTDRSRLVFQCGTESGCALSAVVMSTGKAWTYPTPHMKPSETARTAVVYFESKQAE